MRSPVNVGSSSYVLRFLLLPSHRTKPHTLRLLLRRSAARVVHGRSFGSLAQKHKHSADRAVVQAKQKGLQSCDGIVKCVRRHDNGQTTKYRFKKDVYIYIYKTVLKLHAHTP
jgi:hypothetical protein